MKLDKNILSQWFNRFAEFECKGISPFYHELSELVSKDDALLKIASHCQVGQPVPNLFFGAVHFLLLNNPGEELAGFYPSISRCKQQSVPKGLFKEFCLKNEDKIIELEKSKIVQTNVINRCAYLMPVLSEFFGNTTINMLEIGASAGLNLNLDRYEYHYDGKKHHGNSNISIQSMIKGKMVKEIDHIPVFKNKIGIDKNPLDTTIEENAIWLKSLIWPDQTARFERMENALILAKTEPPKLLKGSTLADFEKVISGLNPDIHLFVYHTHVLYQFSENDRIEFWNMIESFGRTRQLTYLAAEGTGALQGTYSEPGIFVELTTFNKGKKQQSTIAETKGHANWIRWLG